MDEDWDLHAIVKNFTTTSAAVTTAPTNNSIECIEHQQNYSYEENKIFFGNNDIFKPNNNYNPFEELEQLYKPFYPKPKSPSSSSLSISTISTPPKFTEPNPKSFHPKVNKICTKNPVNATKFASRPKRRKNQQKKIVQQVTADSLSDDIWAWRKYGQKPIKGSLYPRNYYRCSSSKGCLARKQIEKSDTDPNMFILTYTGEHSHPRPTHRNSLAGSTRNKYATTPSSTSTVTVTEEDKKAEHTPSLSPTTPLLPELQLQDSKITGTGENTCDAFEDEIIDDEDVEGEDVLIPNTMMSNEDIFMGLEELNHH